MARKFESRKEKYKICVVTGLLAGACFLSYYFHAFLNTCVLAAHIFYAPVILTAVWWRRKGLIVAVFSSVFLIFSHIFFGPDVAGTDDYFRATMFVVISFVVAELSERIAREKEELQAAYEQLQANEQQLKASSQQLQANGQQLKAVDQQLRAEVAEREKSEQRMRFLSSTVEQSSEGLAVTDLEGNLLFSNHAFAALHGYTVDELAGKHLSIFHTAEQIPSVEAASRQIKETGEFSGELLHVRRDGTVFPTLMHNSLLLDEAGNPMGMIGTVRDITERKRAEEELRISEGRYRNLVESCHEVILRKDRDGYYHTLNLSAAIGLGGRCIEDVEGKTDYDLLPKEQADALRKIDEEVMESGKYMEVEEVVRNAQGEDRIYLSRKRPIYDSQGRINGITCFAMDVTERKRAEEELELERDNFINILESMEDGVYIVDRSHDIQYVNPVLKKDFGSFEGKKCYEYFHDLKEECPWCKNEDVFAGKTVRWEWYSFKNEKTYDLIDTPLRNPDGSISKLEIFRDITERKRAEEAVLEYQGKLKSLASELSLAEERERRRIADGIHNDIGTKLALAKFELQSLMEGADETATVAPLESVCAEIDKVIEDARSLTFELSNPMLYEVGLDAAVESWLGQHISKESRLRYEVVSEPRPMKPDVEISVVLFGVIRELLSNVIKHADASMLEVNIQKVDETILVSIEDDGAGFELSKAGLPVKESGGFGLFHVRERVEYLGGRIEIESRPGEGTHIRISVPVQQSTSR